ncbi:hypothetical protein SAMN04488542_10572 [Fontibacillus panacisegetis]|uniref:Uncharacterized protein n=1 Tax=Fontibacillus panacisegetis TaxID=670482 RepID=A0A1G7HYD5_9BACL|nr:hypothetical protein [Fontibacillus panacisegetis]SDF05119.1 hypothetical protein SAMN04488542_10572 [Fontibacillus panacisegetis]
MASTREQKDVSRKSFAQWKARNMKRLASGPRHRGYPSRKELEDQHQPASKLSSKRSLGPSGS